MKKSFLLVIIVLNSLIALAQGNINKGDWMVGGDAGFYKSSNTLFAGANDSKSNRFSVSPNVGYFFIKQLAGGVRASYEHVTDKITSTPNEYKTTTTSIGPFLRYYFLPSTNKTNAFIEGALGFGTQKSINFQGSSGKTDISSYDIKGGIAYFILPSAALEAKLGYRSEKYKIGTTTDIKNLLFDLGFQIHLSKDPIKQSSEVFDGGNINKGNLMIGGSAGLTSAKTDYNDPNTLNIKETYRSFAPNIGYFFIKQLAGGVRFNYFSNKEDYPGQQSLTSSSFGFLPFIRYYFLPPAKRTNLFVDGGYLIGFERLTQQGSAPIKDNQRGYTLKGGVSYFIIPSIALEFAVDYSSTKLSDGMNGYQDNGNIFSINAGFQIHIPGKKMRKSK